MANMILLFSHTLTDLQIKQAKKELNIEKFIYLPDNLQKIWSNVPPDLDNIKQYLQPICTWLKQTGEKDDYILIQGEFGAVYLCVNLAFELQLKAVYSTTTRNYKEILNKDGSISTKHTFKHVIFRRYI